jgi:hypothetical protein
MSFHYGLCPSIAPSFSPSSRFLLEMNERKKLALGCSKGETELLSDTRYLDLFCSTLLKLVGDEGTQMMLSVIYDTTIQQLTN